MGTAFHLDGDSPEPLQCRQDSNQISDVGPLHFNPDFYVPSEACPRQVGGSDVGSLRIRNHDLGVRAQGRKVCRDFGNAKPIDGLAAPLPSKVGEHRGLTWAGDDVCDNAAPARSDEGSGEKRDPAEINERCRQLQGGRRAVDELEQDPSRLAHRRRTKERPKFAWQSRHWRPGRDRSQRRERIADELQRRSDNVCSFQVGMAGHIEECQQPKVCQPFAAGA